MKFFFRAWKTNRKMFGVASLSNAVCKTYPKLMSQKNGATQFITQIQVQSISSTSKTHATNRALSTASPAVSRKAAIKDKLKNMPDLEDFIKSSSQFTVEEALELNNKADEEGGVEAGEVVEGGQASTSKFKVVSKRKYEQKPSF